jgi:hypothetical protein
LLGFSLIPEDGGTIYLRNVSKLLPEKDVTVSTAVRAPVLTFGRFRNSKSSLFLQF